jgi:hypothetical protein
MPAEAAAAVPGMVSIVGAGPGEWQAQRFDLDW